MKLTSIKKRLGDILVDVGIISSAQLKEALEIQKRNGGKLGAILSQMGIINEEVMLAFLGKQCGVSYVSLSEYGAIPAEVLRSIPESIVRHQNLIPISKDNNTVTVAMSDPFNIFAIDDIKLMTGYDVQVVIASESEIDVAIEKYYSRSLDFEVSAGQKQQREMVDRLIKDAIDARAKKILIEPYSDKIRVRFLVDGYLQERSYFKKELLPQMLDELKSLAHFDNKPYLMREKEVRSEYGGRSVRTRVSMITTFAGESAFIDILDPETAPLELSELGFEPETLSVLKKNIDIPRGLVIVAGPPDSGKTTTLNSVISSLNFSDRSILSIAEKISYSIPGVMQVQLQNAGDETHEYLSRLVLRQEPDVVAVDGASTKALADFCLKCAIEGKLVFASVCATSVYDAIWQFMSLGVDLGALSTSISTVLNQRLMRVICPACKESYALPKNLLKNAGILEENEKARFYRGKGCRACSNTGYQGRVGIYEMEEVGDKIKYMILEKASEKTMNEAMTHSKRALLKDAAYKKVSSGISTVEEYLRLIKISV
ncbi:MAG: Flp pilus assembly complex ATPase component TadA [Endomicrobiales bacterium]|nr:Flp pilus assembly complex ATPase component TadA [Endomicrobiales bacterium]